MWRAWPMWSANTVAQNPEGSVNPLLSLGHSGLVVFAPGLGWPCAAAIELTANNTASRTIARKRAVGWRDNRIETLRGISFENVASDSITTLRVMSASEHDCWQGNGASLPEWLHVRDFVAFRD